MVLLKQKLKGTKNYPQGSVSLYGVNKRTKYGLAKYKIVVVYYNTELRNVYFIKKTEALKFYNRLINTGMNNIRWIIKMNISAKGNVVFNKNRYYSI